jgi:MFS family permease
VQRRKLNENVLSNPTFRWLLLFLFVSHIGNWAEGSAINWIVLQKTHSAAALSGIVVLLYVPRSIFSPLGGKLADRNSPARIMQLSQIGMALQSIMLLGATQIEGLAGIVLLFLLQALSGVLSGFNVPAQEAVVQGLVPEERMHNARAAMSTAAFVAGIVGPLVAGVFITMEQTTWVFLLNACTYPLLIVYVSRLGIQREAPAPKNTPTEQSGSVREAFAYIKATPRISYSLMLGGLVDFCLSNMAVTQALIGEQLGGGGKYAMLTAGASVGSLIGAFTLMRRDKKLTMRSMFVAGALYSIFSGAYGASALAHSLPLTMGNIALATIASEYLTNAIGTQRQTDIPKELWTRVNGIAQADRVSSMGLSALFAGAILVPLFGVSYGEMVACMLSLLAVATISHLAKRKHLLETVAPSWVAYTAVGIIWFTTSRSRTSISTTQRARIALAGNTSVR